MLLQLFGKNLKKKLFSQNVFTFLITDQRQYRFEKSKYQYQNNEKIGNFNYRELQERCSCPKPQRSLLPKAAQINLQKSHKSWTEHINHSRMIDKAYIGWGGKTKGNQQYECG